MAKLSFSKGNRKLNELATDLGLKKSQVISFDLPAGHTCPMASECLSKADKITGKITDGQEMKFRCYAASSEAAFTSVRNAHWKNFDAIRNLSIDEITDLILSELPEGVRVVRIHASGDFFSKRYFQAWVRVAFYRPDVTFFGYTKVIEYVKAGKPGNFKLVYSFGGKQDDLLTDEPTCFVIGSIEQAIMKGVEIACPTSNSANDFGYIMGGKSFALLIHGTQPAKPKA